MDKLCTMISLRVSPNLKEDYERLDESMKKIVRDKVRKLIGKICFSELYYDPSFYEDRE